VSAPDDEEHQPPTDDDDALVGEVLDAEVIGHEIVRAPTEQDRALVPAGPRDPLGRFLEQIRRYPLLSEEDERALGRRARDDGDTDAMRRLVVHNLRLVVHIAFEFRRQWTNALDLIQEGSTGLVEASRRWDPDQGARFGTYAGYWIRAFVLRFLLTNFRLVHTGNTRAGRKLFFQLERERRRLLTAGIDPTPKQLASNLGVEESDVREVSESLDGAELSLDAPSPGGGARGLDVVEGGRDPERAAAGQEVLAALRELADAFGRGLTDPRERALWEEHLRSEDPRPLSEIAARFGLTKQRLGQLANGLRARFRSSLVERFGDQVEESLGVGDEGGDV
jgi:RNA polymerase sigma-32 factor